MLRCNGGLSMLQNYLKKTLFIVVTLSILANPLQVNAANLVAIPQNVRPPILRPSFVQSCSAELYFKSFETKTINVFNEGTKKTTLATTDDSGICGDNVNYNFTADTGKLKISGSGAMADYSAYGFSTDTPWEAYKSSIKSVIIDDGVTHIGDNAFNYCPSLTEVSIGNNVESIGTYAFRSCYSLNSVIIPNPVKTISTGAFYVCTGLSSITLPESIVSIGEEAFCKCDSLASIDIPNSVQIIDDMAFASCRNLSEISIGRGLTSIGSQVFLFCENLSSINVSKENLNYKSMDGVFFSKNGTELISYPTGKTGGYVIFDYVNTIADYAFYECINLTSVTIPDTVISLGEWVFSYCTNLNTVNIGNGIKAIPDYAFYNCHSLPKISIGSNVESIGNYAFATCTTLLEVIYKGIFDPGDSSSDVFSFGNKSKIVLVPANYKNSTFCGLPIKKIFVTKNYRPVHLKFRKYAPICMY